jgi:uncharacterized membrane protein
MLMTLSLLIHVSGGSVGLLAGATALITKKGSTTHKQAGKLYVPAMIIMAISGVYVAFMASKNISVLAGMLCLYLVVSGWLSVKPDKKKLFIYNPIIISLGLLVSLFGTYLCRQALNGITDSLQTYWGTYSVPAPIYFVFTSLAFVGVAGDIKHIFKGALIGKYRIARHLWRMCIPLYIGASSLFTGQVQIFPEILRGSIVLSFPHYLVLLTMLYWLGKTLINNEPLSGQA